MVHVPFLPKQIKVEPLDNGLNNEEIAAAMVSPHGCSVAADAPLAPPSPSFCFKISQKEAI
jgi:hypothetical protein